MTSFRLTTLAAVSLTSLVCLSASAQNIKPGLWEVSSKSDAMAALSKQLASMPPEQRKMMQDMMAKQGGIQLDAGGDGGIVMKMCLTKELINEAMHYSPPSGNCKHTKGAAIGGTMKFSYTCTNPPQTGEGVVKYIGDSAYTSTFTGTSSVNGKPHTTTIEGKGKLLSSDCGSVKPIDFKAGTTVPKAK